MKFQEDATDASPEGSHGHSGGDEDEDENDDDDDDDDDDVDVQRMRFTENLRKSEATKDTHTVRN